MNDQPPDLIDLQHANAFQATRKGEKGPWQIRKNVTGEVLATLPAELTDPEMFEILRFARKFELLAFNIGIGHGKKIGAELHLKTIEGLRGRLAAATEENAKIADHLDKLTRGAEANGNCRPD